MKKILVLLMVMAIAMGAVFAVDAAGSTSVDSVTTSASSNRASLEVTVDLSQYEGLYTFGFTGTEVAAATGEGAQAVTITPLTSIGLTPENDEFTGSAYVYYAVKAPNAQKLLFDVTLSGPLTNGTKNLAWQVSDGTGTEVVKSTAPETAANVGEFTSAGTYAIGSFPIKMTTDGFLSFETEDVTELAGSVYLTIRTEE